MIKLKKMFIKLKKMFISIVERHVKYVIHIGDKYNEKVKGMRNLYDA